VSGVNYYLNSNHTNCTKYLAQTARPIVLRFMMMMMLMMMMFVAQRRDYRAAEAHYSDTKRSRHDTDAGSGSV